jgi:hypothetical protein
MLASITTVGMLLLILLLGKRANRPTGWSYALVGLAAVLETGLVLLYLYQMTIPTP